MLKVRILPAALEDLEGGFHFQEDRERALGYTYLTLTSCFPESVNWNKPRASTGS